LLSFQQALALPELERLEVLHLDRFLVLDLNHAAGTDGGFERHLVHADAVGDEMQRGVHVRAGMNAHVQHGDVADGAVVHADHALELYVGLIRPVRRADVEGGGDVDPGGGFLFGGHGREA
jgi:hypothetical protein